MKKLLFTSVIILLFVFSKAQNVQLHYDLGNDRGYFTSTVEMFKPDKLGNTFFFIDFDYNVGEVKGVSISYFEIARCFTLGKSPLSWHAEYNGGFGQWKAGIASGAYSINNAWLTGLDYSWNAADFSRGFSLKALFKTIRHKYEVSFQLTGVWYLNFAKKFSFTGFADFWREDNIHTISATKKETTKYVFLSEPQLWFNINKTFSVGSEVELSNNFGGLKGFQAMPTLGAKVTF
jgi:hypothetical protein